MNRETKILRHTETNWKRTDISPTWAVCLITLNIKRHNQIWLKKKNLNRPIKIHMVINLYKSQRVLEQMTLMVIGETFKEYQSLA